MGSGTGKTCGKGHKGQMARKGHKHKTGFEGGQMTLIRRVPKRGFKNSGREIFFPVNVGLLSSLPDGSEVTRETLMEMGLVKGAKAALRIKVLGTGELNKKLTVKAQAFSDRARQKIEAAGGVCTTVVD